ncbi:MAG: ATP phosphoribosyltransferase regulatory subunit, partial [Leptospiraceae bacterium]|nr:ATP phosphoribosyltransferase regulatory subunit [Leptospiraceae bacterium]
MRFETPKGTKDWAFKEAQKREKIIQTIVDVFKKWGYEPLYTPSLEMKKTLEAKAGEELNTQIFKIEKSDYGLRFDLTVGTARFVASSSIVQPYKRYSQGTVWRREEPQKGRLREFTQIDADIFGVEGEEAEAELLALSCEILERLGFRKFKIYLNNREIISDLIEKYNKKEKENIIKEKEKRQENTTNVHMNTKPYNLSLSNKEINRCVILNG